MAQTNRREQQLEAAMSPPFAASKYKSPISGALKRNLGEGKGGSDA